MRAKRDLFRSLTLAAMVDSASRMCRGLPLPSLKVAASYIRTYDGRDNLRAARTPKIRVVSLPCGRYRFVIVSLSFRPRLVHVPVAVAHSLSVAFRRLRTLGRSRSSSTPFPLRLRCYRGLVGRLRHHAAAPRPHLATYSLQGGSADPKSLQRRGPRQ